MRLLTNVTNLVDLVNKAKKTRNSLIKTETLPSFLKSKLNQGSL
jgi:hypothetical protein